MWDTAPEQIRSLLDRYDIVHPFTVVYMDVDQALKATQNDWLKYLEVARDLVNTIHCVATHLNPVFNTPPEALTVDDLKRTHLIARSLKDGASSLALTQMSRAMANIETVLALTLSADETTKANGKSTCRLHTSKLCSHSPFMTHYMSVLVFLRPIQLCTEQFPRVLLLC